MPNPSSGVDAAGVGTTRLAFFERRVKGSPGRPGGSVRIWRIATWTPGWSRRSLSEYAVALELDPDDAEALAHVGIILYQNGRSEEALRSVDRALSTDPRYPRRCSSEA